MKTVFVDIDTQLDFVYPAGALYVPGAERIVPAVARLNREAAARGVTLISTMDAHAEDDPEFRTWPHHCIAGTLGQRKPEETLVDGRVVVPNRTGALAFANARQIVLEKQTVNAFETVTIGPVLEALGAERFVIYGVVTEVCVLHAARGLLKLGKRVEVVTDAICGLRPEDAERALAELRRLGTRLVTSAQLAQSDKLEIA